MSKYRERLDELLGQVQATLIEWEQAVSGDKLVGYWSSSLTAFVDASESQLSNCEQGIASSENHDGELRQLKNRYVWITNFLKGQSGAAEFSKHGLSVLGLLEEYLRAFEECKPITVKPPTIVLNTGDSLEQAYKDAKWGDVIEVNGLVEKFKMDASKYSSTPQDPIIIRAGANGGRILMNGAGGSSTISMKDRGAAYTIFEGLELEADDTATFAYTNSQKEPGDDWNYPGIEYHRCKMVNGWDWHSNSGPTENKWGCIDYGMVDNKYIDTEIIGVKKEHARYSHNHLGDQWFVRCLFGNLGRTATQFASRRTEGKPGKGDIYYLGSHFLETTLQPQGGGSSISINGGCPTTKVFIINHTNVLGADPKLHPIAQPNITGGLVVHQGELTEQLDAADHAKQAQKYDNYNATDDYGGTDEVYIENGHWEVGKVWKGEGSARRPNLRFTANINKVTIVGTSVYNYVGAQLALAFEADSFVKEGIWGQKYPGSIKEIVLDRNNDIRGDCSWNGKEFRDRDDDGDGLPDGYAYQEMLRYLENEPRVKIIDWDPSDKFKVPDWVGEIPLVGEDRRVGSSVIIGIGNGGGSDDGEEPIPGDSGDLNLATVEGAWTWLWAGENSKALEVQGKLNRQTIKRIRDSSGNGRDAVPGRSYAGYRVGVTIENGKKAAGYSTKLPLIGIDKWPDGTQCYGNTYLFQSSTGASVAFPGDGAFYYAGVFLNSRDGGERELVGSDEINFIRIDQERDTAKIRIQGRDYHLGEINVGLNVLELIRGPLGNLQYFINRKKIGEQATEGAWRPLGLGDDGKGSSQFDDVMGEHFFATGNPEQALSGAIGNSLVKKWSS